MNRTLKPEWSKPHLFIIRFLLCYLLCYFLFLSDFFFQNIPFQEYVHAPFKFISEGLIRAVNRAFIHRTFAAGTYTGIDDTSWFFMSSIIYLTLSLIATTIWTLLGVQDMRPGPYLLLHTYARYYLAFVLFFYGFDKVFGNQFPDTTPDSLIQSIGRSDGHTLFWALMGSSEAYNYFGGLVEIAVGTALLFRKTSTLGGLAALALMVNILFLDISSDTMVKFLLVDLILIAIFIITPDFKRVYSFFLAGKNTELRHLPTFNLFTRNHRLHLILKSSIIVFVLYHVLEHGVTFSKINSSPFLGGLDGVYETELFQLNHIDHPPLTTDTVRWRRLAINKFGDAAVQFMNDSIQNYSLKGDTSAHTFTLSIWNDPTFKSSIHYTLIGPNEYLFEAAVNSDTIRVESKKLHLADFPLMRKKGITKWFW